MVSRSDNVSGLATTRQAFVLFPHMFTQGRLHCTQHTILCTALQVHTGFVREEASVIGVLNFVAQGSGLHGSRVVCAMPLARARDP